MSVTITIPFANLSFTLTAQNVDDPAGAIRQALGTSSGPIRGVQVAAEPMGDRWDSIEGIAIQMDDSDRIEAVRIDEDACRAEPDVAAHPVDPRRLH